MRHETLIIMLNWISGTTIICQLSYPLRLSFLQILVTDIRAALGPQQEHMFVKAHTPTIGSFENSSQITNVYHVVSIGHSDRICVQLAKTSQDCKRITRIISSQYASSDLQCHMHGLQVAFLDFNTAQLHQSLEEVHPSRKT